MRIIKFDFTDLFDEKVICKNRYLNHGEIINNMSKQTNLGLLHYFRNR